MTTFSETTLPALIFTVPAGHPKGTADALGKLTVTDTQNANQAWMIAAWETNDKYDITAATGALFYEAEARTLLSSSAIATHATASGAGGTNNIVQTATLPPVNVPVWSTQASGGGAHLTHVGQFRVFMRVLDLTGTVTLRLDWAVSDFGVYTSNDSVTLTAANAGNWTLADLGMVNIPTVLTGPQRWEGRIIANCSIGTDTLRLDCMFLIPVDYGSGEVTATTQAASGQTLAIYDSFDQTAGALAGKVTGIGAATWTFQEGDTDDWSVDATNHYASRATAITDTAPRFISAGTTNYANVTVARDISFGTGDGTVNTGLFLRYVDTSNYVVALYGGDGAFQVFKRVAGVNTNLDSIVFGTGPAYNTWYTLTVSADPSGTLSAWLNPRGGTLGSMRAISVTDSVLATGGALATGKVGLYENVYNGTFSPNPRLADRFTVYSSAATSPPDAAIFATRSLQLRYDGAVRQDSTGTVYATASNFEGNLLRVPITQREQRKIRFIVKASRSVPGVGGDTSIDDIQATLSYVPRYLSVPVPT